MSVVAEAFDPASGSLAQLPSYRYRESQQRMAELIWAGIEQNRHAALEAGTGVGKTFAYLVPALLSGRRTIISTGTKPLQDQIFDRDLPLLAERLGMPAEVAVLKGRANYLCWHRLQLAAADASLSREDADIVAALEDWGRDSPSGDLSELADLDAEPRLRARVTSNPENCLGQKCASFDRCFVAQARRSALDAAVVIVNHHLLLADLALRETGFGDLLGDAELVVVDEAHLLPDIAQDFFSTSASTREFEILLGDLQGELLAAKVDRARLPALAEFSSALIGLRRLKGPAEGRRPWRSLAPRLLAAIEELVDFADALAGALQRIEPPTPGISRCRERLEDQCHRARGVFEYAQDEAVRWFECTQRSVSVHATPLEVGAQFAQRIGAHGAQWVFTSATLAVGEDFSHFLDRIGLPDADTCVLPSPFDYAGQAALYLPEGLPDPGDADYLDALLTDVWPLVEAAGGGAFVLFTSHRALQAAAEWAGRQQLPGPLLVQGALGRTELLERFRDAGNAVLLGTGSFWQGVDVRGDALRVVVIDKLPFAVPGDPQVEARVQAIRRRGGNPFVEYQLPQAVLALKQGVGRLIRDFDDRGLIVLGDPRLRTRSYGRVFLDSLPPAALLDGRADALEFARQLNPSAAAAEPA